MTLDEFIIWTGGDGGRWQLVDGEPRAMSPAAATASSRRGWRF